MKNLLLIIAMILSFSVFSQKKIILTKTFLRVYDIQGKKISKGKIASISETTLSLNRNGKYIELPVSNIGLIRTKHADGTNVIVGAAIGIPVGALVGRAGYEPGFLSFSPSVHAAIGGGIGGVVGAAFIPLATLPFKKSQTYVINGDPEKWKTFLEYVRQ
jgi:hypothetical protein